MKTDLAAVSLILGACLLIILLVSPQHEFPLNDDWDYSQAVQEYLETGRLRTSQWSNATVVFQIYWGSLFARLAGGLSFTALRGSTLVMGAAGVLGFYACLRLVRVSSADSVLGALVLLVNPLYVYLSYTFMSDVFFVSLMLLSIAAYLAGLRRGSNLWLLAGSVCATLAFLTRQPAIVLPVVALAAWLYQERSFSWRAVSAIIVVPAVALLLYSIWLLGVNELPWMTTYRLAYGTIFSTPDWIQRLISRVLVSLPYIGLFASPLVAGAIVAQAAKARSTPVRQLAIVIGLVIAIAAPVWWAASKYPGGLPYFSNVINVNGLGSMGLALGIKATVVPAWVMRLAEVIGIPAGAMVAALGVKAVIEHGWNRVDPAAILIVGTTVLITAGYYVFSLFLDRYLLTLVPLAIVMLLKLSPLNWAGRLTAGAACLAVAVYSLVGVADHLAWNEARWVAGRMLVAQGVQPEAIDGGYEWIGWYEFPNVPPPASVTADLDPLYWMKLHSRQYVLAFSPVEGYSTVFQVPYGNGDAIVVAVEEGESDSTAP